MLYLHKYDYFSALNGEISGLDTVIVKTQSGSYAAEKGTVLLAFLHDIGMNIPSDCGGAGFCGKCEMEIECDGIVSTVRSCQYCLDRDITVLSRAEAAGEIKTDNRIEDLVLSSDYVAIDLGTTAVSAAVCMEGKLFELTELNALSSSGRDVISRSEYIRKNNCLAESSGMLRRQLAGMIRKICSANGLPVPGRVTVGGNTIMQHILAGVDPYPITVYPFEPASLFKGEDRYVKLDDEITAELMPCVAGYFGGDLTAGLLYLRHRMEKDETALLIDIGTNGEMALINGDSITCCSVASGPAFEGGNIECGMTGTDGAIDHVSLTEEGIRYSTIGNTAPKGICGSGIIDLVSVLLKMGIVDTTGRFLPPSETDIYMGGYTEDENENGMLYLGSSVFITAKDIRMIQMAKAALAAGIEILLRECGLDQSQVDTVYLAGGFGTLMDVSSAADIGMIPEGFRNRCVPCGNTSLKGAARAAVSQDAGSELAELCGRCRYIELSSYSDFNGLYVSNMMFGG
ncbi:MAG: DUF4445 domain-containing protein [Oscillospiraceae bacterium]|nr:DUF4445 domain-containing protein [Oscillospiraceae bacterium]